MCDISQRLMRITGAKGAHVVMLSLGGGICAQLGVQGCRSYSIGPACLGSQSPKKDSDTGGTKLATGLHTLPELLQRPSISIAAVMHLMPCSKAISAFWAMFHLQILGLDSSNGTKKITSLFIRALCSEAQCVNGVASALPQSTWAGRPRF